MIKTRSHLQSRSGKAVGTLVLLSCFCVLLPIWLLGNLFVSYFPPLNEQTANRVKQVGGSNEVVGRNSPEIMLENLPKTELNQANDAGIQATEKPINTSLERQVDELASAEESASSSAALIESKEQQSTSSGSTDENSVPSADITLEQVARTESIASFETSRPEPEIRTWTRAQDGKTVQATLIRVEGSNLVLRLPSGKDVTISEDIFTQADIDYATQFQPR